MTDDPKVNFYLAHREQIEEWASLRHLAADMLDQALLAAVHQLANDEAVPTPTLVEGRDRYAKLPVMTAMASDVAIELGWSRSRLLAASDGWPSLRIAVDPSHSATLKEAVLEATMSGYVTHGLDQKSHGWWLRWGLLKLPSELRDLEEFAVQCVNRWRDAYLDLAPRIRLAVESLEDAH